MSMEVSRKQGQYQADYAERLKEEREKAREAQREQKAEKAEKEQKAGKTSDKAPASQDEYISSEKAGAKPNGLYCLGQDEDGNKKIIFEDPKKAAKSDGREQPGAKPAGSDKDKTGGQPRVNPDGPGKSEEKCVGSTDKVDREIKELKQKKQQLEQQLRSASGDENKVKELEKKLGQVERELSQKDNDTYRRQHSTFTDK